MSRSRCVCTETDGNRYCVEHGGKTPSTDLLRRAARLAAKCDDAYSSHAYLSWTGVAKLLLSRGFSEMGSRSDHAQ